jgi:hypothetical protein
LLSSLAALRKGDLQICVQNRKVLLPTGKCSAEQLKILL